MATLRTLATKQGKEVMLARIENKSGAYVELLSYGAAIAAVVVPDRQGRLENVALNYGNVEGYFADTCYLGSTVGRVANRISGGQFTLGGKVYVLDKNDGQNSNHGGFNGFHQKNFDCVVSREKVIFSTESSDGEGGFPGNVHLEVMYAFSEKNELQIEYSLWTDKATVVNITNHAYFNLNPACYTILTHELEVNADKHLEFDRAFLPTGNILPTAGAAYDFSTYKAVGQMQLLKNELNIKGYNAYFIGKENGGLHRLASLKERTSGRELKVYSTMPGVQFYTGDYLTGAHQPFEGLCLEAQLYPDAPNKPNFPSCVVEPDTEYRHAIVYSFGLTQ
ncbi:MAG: galactose mutarotase [Prevotellaceae bacterium]|jgi:aldose 1-epimerase|nr:galactose mutarotase [Prevotellaceae bacterium]